MRGMLSIEDKNTFAILKEWLYADKDIAFRELIANAADAIRKRAALDASAPAGRIDVRLCPDERRIIISDNGVGMTAAEVERYINRIAFSGATEFVAAQSAEGNGADAPATIIGHFGVGFYSAFMLADHVAIESRSWQQGEDAVRWDCDAEMVFTLGTGDRAEAGTDIICYLNDDIAYAEDPAVVLEVIRRYFTFLPVPIHLHAESTEGFEDRVVNDLDPIWRRPRGQQDADAMRGFYKEFFGDQRDPLFWLPIESTDIGLSGIVFFRDTRNGTEELDGSFKVYSRGVYIGENIPELIPPFVNLQSGIIECDELPLVVSRSTIRADGAAQDGAAEGRMALIAEALAQEVTIALHFMFENDRASYEGFWPDLGPFVKYGVLKDRMFASVMARKLIFKDIQGRYLTIREYLGSADEGIVHYVTDAIEQAHYVHLFRRCGRNALLLDHVIDQPLLRQQEAVHPKLRFLRVDTDIEEVFGAEGITGDGPTAEALERLLRSCLSDRLGRLEPKAVRLATDGISLLIVNDEQSRRMADMMEMYGLIKGTGSDPGLTHTQGRLLANLASPLVAYALEADRRIADLYLNQLFDLALLGQGALDFEDIEALVARTERLLTLLAEADT